MIQEHGVSLHAQTVIHSDQGCHYTSCKFIELVERSDLRRSMSRKGNCRDNAPQESFFGHMKDLIDLTDNLSFGEVKAVIDDHMSYYNSERLQWDLAKLSPNEYFSFVTTAFIRLISPASPRCLQFSKRPMNLVRAPWSKRQFLILRLNVKLLRFIQLAVLFDTCPNFGVSISYFVLDKGYTLNRPYQAIRRQGIPGTASGPRTP